MIQRPKTTGKLIAHTQGEGTTMDALLISATLFGSFLGAFALQKAALEGLFRIMDHERRERH